MDRAYTTGVATQIRPSNAQPPKDSMIGNVSSSVASAVSELSNLTRMAEDIADSLFGAVPSPGNAEKSSPPPGSLGSVSFELDVLSTVIHNLRSQIERLSCL